MNFARFRTTDGAVLFGELADGVLRTPSGDYATEDVTLLAPCVPSKIICVGLNYRDHADEIGMELPDEPLLFFKPPSAVIGPDADIVRPNEATQLDYEAELTVVIGRRARNVAAEYAESFIAGYTIGNDVTARNFQTPGSQWTRAKGFDTFAPLGPVVTRGLDPTNLEIECRVNGEQRQKSNTSQMVFGVADLLAFASSIMTLEPGDVIMTGTPPGVGELSVDDRVEISVDGIGTLRNNVVRPDHQQER
ncbi:MAG: fumarylacetoacetate hydrolase family protein [Actinobacteria bacterium]|nr:fumarylacetoacetate hydrolase family protein [Actinomycetota bacterium]